MYEEVSFYPLPSAFITKEGRWLRYVMILMIRQRVATIHTYIVETLPTSNRDWRFSIFIFNVKIL